MRRDDLLDQRIYDHPTEHQRVEHAEYQYDQCDEDIERHSRHCLASVTEDVIGGVVRQWLLPSHDT